MVWDKSLSITIDVSKTDVALLPEKMLEYALEVLLDQAHLMVGLAQVYAPVDTGSLRDSIRVERGGEGQGWKQVRIRAGGYIINPKTGRFVDYAGVVESRQPFMRPAFDEVEPTIVQMLQSGVIAKLGMSNSGVEPI
jgi:hypothetical protein